MDEWRGEKFISAIRKVVCVIVDPLNLTKTKNIKKTFTQVYNNP